MVKFTFNYHNVCNLIEKILIFKWIFLQLIWKLEKHNIVITKYICKSCSCGCQYFSVKDAGQNRLSYRIDIWFTRFSIKICGIFKNWYFKVLSRTFDLQFFLVEFHKIFLYTVCSLFLFFSFSFFQSINFTPADSIFYIHL